MTGRFVARASTHRRRTTAWMFLFILGMGRPALAQEQTALDAPTPIALPGDLPPPPTRAAKANALRAMRTQAASQSEEARGANADAERLALEHAKQQREDNAWLAEAQTIRSDHNGYAALTGGLLGVFGAAALVGGIATADSSDKDLRESSLPLLITGASFLAVAAIVVPILLVTRPTLPDAAPAAGQQPAEAPQAPLSPPPPPPPPPPGASNSRSTHRLSWSVAAPFAVTF